MQKAQNMHATYQNTHTYTHEYQYLKFVYSSRTFFEIMKIINFQDSRIYIHQIFWALLLLFLIHSVWFLHSNLKYFYKKKPTHNTPKKWILPKINFILDKMVSYQCVYNITIITQLTYYTIADGWFINIWCYLAKIWFPFFGMPFMHFYDW